MITTLLKLCFSSLSQLDILLIGLFIGIFIGIFIGRKLLYITWKTK